MIKPSANLPNLSTESILEYTKRSIACSVFMVCLIFGSLLGINGTLFSFLTITPRYLLPPNLHFWTLNSYPFVETNLLLICLSVYYIHMAAVYLETSWGTKEVVKFFFLVTYSVGLVAPLLLILCYSWLVSDPDLIFSTPLHGMIGFSSAVAVAMKQIMPDSVLVETPIGRLKNSHMPQLLFVCCFFAALLRVLQAVVPLLCFLGIYFSWLYLRFYQNHANGVSGDMADHFSCVNFFPQPVRPALAPLANGFYRVAVQLKICKPAIRRIIEPSDTAHLPPISVQLSPLEGSKHIEKERRRQKALRDLNERLIKEGAEKQSWPSLEPESIPQTHASSALSLPSPQQPHELGEDTMSALSDASQKTSQIPEEGQGLGLQTSPGLAQPSLPSASPSESDKPINE